MQEIRDSHASESSAEVAVRVAEARKRQQERFRDDGIHCNAQMDSQLIRQYCQTRPEADQLLHQAVEALHMSMRAYSRILKVARTIADLDHSDSIRTEHVAEAIQYRELDQKYWS